MGWKNPFESDTTPGEASVITWFSPDEDSSGSLEMAFLRRTGLSSGRKDPSMGIELQ
jgi:hypothetical protein